MKNSILLSLCIIAAINYQAASQATYAASPSAEPFEIGNMLSWQTTAENGVKAFVIEKSLDGITFEHIGKVKANGTAINQSYNFLDVAADKGIAYYRLKEELTGDKMAYSATVSTQKTTGNNFTIISMTTPTDLDPTFELTLSTAKEDIMNYKIYDMKGNLVFQQKQILKKGINILSVDLSQLNDSLGFAGNNNLLGDKVGYKVALEGKYEAEMLTIAPRNKDVRTLAHKNQ